MDPFLLLIHFRNYCGLDWLAGEAIRFMQLHFESIWKEPEFLIEDSLNYEQLTRLLEADDLCVDCEDNVYYCVTRWLNRYVVELTSTFLMYVEFLNVYFGNKHGGTCSEYTNIARKI